MASKTGAAFAKLWLAVWICRSATAISMSTAYLLVHCPQVAHLISVDQSFVQSHLPGKTGTKPGCGCDCPKCCSVEIGWATYEQCSSEWGSVFPDIAIVGLATSDLLQGSHPKNGMCI